MLFSDNEIKKILSEAKNIVIVGAKDKAGQPVDNVGRYLINAGYNVLPVHPKRQVVWGLPAAPTMADIPELSGKNTPDIIVLFRAAEFCHAHALEAAALPVLPRLFWMQLGIANAEAAQIMQHKNVTVVQNSCIMVEHRRLLSGSIL